MIIGVLTFQQAINYGAILQLYALQKSVKNLGVEVEIINYISPVLKEDYKLVRFRNGIKNFIASLISLRLFNNKKKKFDRFIKEYMCLSESVFQKNELHILSQKYDYVIAGSDQVWNYQITNNDSTYLLDFVDCSKRVSYAASFGLSDIPLPMREIYINLLQEFKYITVREKQGAELIENLCRKNVPVVLDPTLLLNKQDWNAITSKLSVKKTKIVVYTLFRSDLLFEYALELSKKTGLEIAVINPRVRNIFSKTSMYDSGPEEFVDLIMNAEYVLTNSFHGTVFSINFNKKFLVELPKGEGAQRNSRIVNILEVLRLENRCVDTLDLEKMYADIDWENVNNILSEERNKSIEHLKKMIGKDE